MKISGGGKLPGLPPLVAGLFLSKPLMKYHTQSTFLTCQHKFLETSGIQTENREELIIYCLSALAKGVLSFAFIFFLLSFCSCKTTF